MAGVEVDDIVQETYAALANLKSVAHIQSPRAYAFQTARSLIRKHLRRARIVRFEPLDETDLALPAFDAPSPEREAASRQDLRRVASLIAALPPRRREALILRKIEGLSQEEVALRMGISQSTVEKQVGHALRALMEATGRTDRRRAERTEELQGAASL